MPTVDLDSFDWRIIRELQRDGRTTNQALAENIGLSPSPCLRRVKILEQTGVISRYVALINPEPLGLTVTAFVRVRLGQQSDRHIEAFEGRVSGLSEVMECYLMTGDSDYQLRVLCPSLSEFEDFLRHKLTRIEGVSQVTTSFALRPVVYRTALPVAEERS